MFGLKTFIHLPTDKQNYNIDQHLMKNFLFKQIKNTNAFMFSFVYHDNRKTRKMRLCE
jgi:hypothetical protein